MSMTIAQIEQLPVKGKIAQLTAIVSEVKSQSTFTRKDGTGQGIRVVARIRDNTGERSFTFFDPPKAIEIGDAFQFQNLYVKEYNGRKDIALSGFPPKGVITYLGKYQLPAPPQPGQPGSETLDQLIGQAQSIPSNPFSSNPGPAPAPAPSNPFSGGNGFTGGNEFQANPGATFPGGFTNAPSNPAPAMNQPAVNPFSSNPAPATAPQPMTPAPASMQYNQQGIPQDPASIPPASNQATMVDPGAVPAIRALTEAVLSQTKTLNACFSSTNLMLEGIFQEIQHKGIEIMGKFDSIYSRIQKNTELSPVEIMKAVVQAMENAEEYLDHTAAIMLVADSHNIDIADIVG